MLRLDRGGSAAGDAKPTWSAKARCEDESAKTVGQEVKANEAKSHFE